MGQFLVEFDLTVQNVLMCCVLMAKVLMAKPENRVLSASDF